MCFHTLPYAFPASPRRALLLGLAGIAYRFHGGNGCRNPSRRTKADIHRQQADQRRPGQHCRRYRIILKFIGLQEQHHHIRKEQISHGISCQKPCWDPDGGQAHCLPQNDPAQLLSGSPDGFQQAVILDILGDGNIKNIVNDQVAGNQDDRQKDDYGQDRVEIDAE